MRGWWQRVKVVLSKEIRDHTRDRRSLLLALLYPLLAPLLLAGGLGLSGSALQGIGTDQVILVPVVGAEYAPKLVSFMAESNIRLVHAPKDPERAVRHGLVPLVVIIPPEAATSPSYQVTFLVNLSRIGNLKSSSRVAEVIADYNRQAALAVAETAGVPPEAVAPISIERVSVARQSNIAVFFYNLMPPLIIFMIFLGGVYIAIDTTAGERERGSLEPLLIAPVKRWELLLAKSLTALVFTAVTMAVNLGGFFLFLSASVWNSTFLLPPPGVGTFALIYLVALPLMAVAVALQMSISMITRTMKEAQIILGLLPLVPALPGMVMVFAPMSPTLLTASIPVLGQMLLFNQLVAEEAVNWGHLALSAAVTTAFAGLIFWGAVRLFKREKMFFLG